MKKKSFFLLLFITGIFFNQNSFGYYKLLDEPILPESLGEFINAPSNTLISRLKEKEFVLEFKRSGDDLTAKTGKKIKTIEFGYKINEQEIFFTCRVQKNGDEIISFIQSLTPYDDKKKSEKEFKEQNIMPHIKTLKTLGFKFDHQDSDYTYFKKLAAKTQDNVDCQFSHGKMFSIEFSVED